MLLLREPMGLAPRSEVRCDLTSCSVVSVRAYTSDHARVACRACLLGTGSTKSNVGKNLNGMLDAEAGRGAGRGAGAGEAW